MDQDTNHNQERAWILQAKAGDTEAFGNIVREYQARLRAYAARYIQSNDDVYDIVQDAFLNAFQNLDRFDETRDFGPWLRTICRNRVLNYYRSQKTRRSQSLSVIDEALLTRITMTEDDNDDNTEQIDALRQCMTKLGTEQKKLIGLRYREGLAIADLAEMFTKTVSSIAMRLTRIRGRLRDCMNRRLES